MSNATFLTFLERLLDNDDDSPLAVTRSISTTTFESEDALRIRFAAVFLTPWQARIAVAALTNSAVTGVVGSGWLRRCAPGADAREVARVVCERVVGAREKRGLATNAAFFTEVAAARS
jgi:hypothetical protein